MFATIIKFLAIAAGLFLAGRIAWKWFLKYKVKQINLAALRVVDNKIKALMKMVDKADYETALELAEIKAKNARVKELAELLAQKLNP